MRSVVLLAFSTSLAFVAPTASAQTVTFTGTVGTPMTVPPPPASQNCQTTGAPGTAFLSAGWWQPQQNLVFTLSCIDPAWVCYPSEVVVFGFSVGTATLPGVPFLNGTMYIPLLPSTIIAIPPGPNSGVAWLGPGDTVPPTSFISPPGTCTNPVFGYGRAIKAPFPIVAGMPIAFTAQAMVFDTANNLVYTTNAINAVMQ